MTNSNKNILCLFVGDSDQAIFTSLNGSVKSREEVEELTGLDFRSLTLDGCFRSSQQIIDFYSNFQQSSYYIKSYSEYKDTIGCLDYRNNVTKGDLSSSISDIINEALEKGIPESEICVVAPQYYILSNVTKELKVLLPGVNFRSQDIYPIKPDDLNIFFKISFLIFTTSGERIKLRKIVANEIMFSLREAYGITFDKEFTPLDFLDILNSTKSNSLEGIIYFEENSSTFFLSINRK